MASVGTILKRTFFWAYERGTWQYDVAVVIILIFVFLPRGWFRDEPVVGVSANAPGQVALVAGTEKSDHQTYRVDARVLAPPEKTPALQNELHQALRRALPDLRNVRFSIINIEAVRDEEGTVIAYQVEISR
jgi:hypothetical protein